MKTNLITPIAGAVLVALTAAAQPQSPHRLPPRHVDGELLVKFKDGPRGVDAERARRQMRHEDDMSVGR